MAFNSKQYAWVDITAVMGGTILEGVRGIKYGEKREKEFVYGKGGKPQGIQTKNTSYEGEITILQSELEALIDASPDKSILGVVIDNLTVAYAPDGSTDLVTDQIVHIEFTESMKEMKQGDAFMEISLPIMFLDLKHQV